MERYERTKALIQLGVTSAWLGAYYELIFSQTSGKRDHNRRLFEDLRKASDDAQTRRLKP